MTAPDGAATSGARLEPLDPAAGALTDDFSAPELDPTLWVDHYLPQWTTPERSRARYDVGHGRDALRPADDTDDAAHPTGLRLRIDADQPDWRPEDAPLRVSNLQTATFGGPVGSARGTHRHRPDGLVVRTAVPQRLLWAPTSGQADVTVTASLDRACMLAVWLVGTEHLDEQDSGEVCVVEMDADAVGPTTTRARVGIKAHHDPRLTTDMTEVTVPVGAGQAHTWSARWDAEGVVVACDGAPVYTSAQVIDYPMQLMVDLFEIGPRDPADVYPKTAVVHSVALSRPVDGT
ncbi:hypothetical protein [Cellulomonas carbonis]|uniref:Glycosyl hydrolase n=1 Tax=Cellulomonas carbonis T26 TaxID=947969 RepID=A0A0A0BSQ7_9CELL|nr:hypothetical protein [Cellulomonas carbonis]KGM10687.1 glycosyl hydrolase [Cellulomonas carbonis T26]GGC07668.1 hypothetical protein GCM10010972_21180 [Cellulomonas carbonis]